MMRWIVGSSLRFRYIVVALAAGMMVFGVVQLRGIPVDVFPEFAPPRVQIQTACLGLSAADVEQQVTVPLEDGLNGIPGLDVMRSASVPHLASIELIFKLGTDLLRVPGVANVTIWGERLQIHQVPAEPEKMRAHDVSLEQVMETTADALDVGLLKFSNGAVVGTGGFLDTPNQRLQVRHILPITTPEDLSQVIIETQSGKALRLGDVAQVVEGHQPLAGDAVINDGPGLMLIVEKLPWANTLDVTRGVEQALRELQPGLPGIDVDPTIF